MKELSSIKELNFLLDRKHIYFKTSQVYKRGDSVECTILPYKDARTDMDILDDCVGSDDWQVDYKRDSKGILQGGIGIWSESKDQWIWKWSNGTPSAFESDKGEYSDAFKRAGFMWGIGRCLYNFPEIRLILNDKEWHEKDGKVKVAGWFKPNQFRWEVSGTLEDLHIRCAQRFSNSWTTRYDNKPSKTQKEKNKK